MTARPWMKWYPADWRQEPTLRLCSRAARSLWMDLLGLMHEATPYGHLLINGIRPSPAQIAAILGDREKDVQKWLIELEEAAVFSRTSEGVIYSRRMVGDQERSEEGRQYVEKRWANREPNSHPNRAPITQKPEARSQKPEKESDGDFELWWAAYPRHVAKGAARKAYAVALKKADAATLLAGAVRAAERYAQTEQQFIPHPATWLNHERWLDEQSSAVVPPPADDRWEPRLRAYRADLDAGKARPFWNEFWGPNPTQPNCDAPPEKLERYGFGKQAA